MTNIPSHIYIGCCFCFVTSLIHSFSNPKLRTENPLWRCLIGNTPINLTSSSSSVLQSPPAFPKRRLSTSCNQWLRLTSNLSVRRSVKCNANPRRVKMVAKQIMRELSDMLLTDTVLQRAVLPEAALGAFRYLSSLTTISDFEVSNDLQVVKVYVNRKLSTLGVSLGSE